MILFQFIARDVTNDIHQRINADHFFRADECRPCQTDFSFQRLINIYAAIEPVIGHLEDDHRMGRNYLAHSSGDAINAMLAALRTVPFASFPVALPTGRAPPKASTELQSLV